MANTLTPFDVYQIVNAASRQMFGANTTLQAVDTSSFVTVGQAMLANGYENTFNALSLAVGKTIIAVRPYTGRYSLFNVNNQEYGQITRKISFFHKGNEESGDWNTQLNPEQLKEGNSIDHYKISKSYPLEVNFAGLKVLQKSITRFRKQLKVAFRSEREFADFYAGLAVELNNEIVMNKEAENQLQLLNHIGGVYNTGLPGQKVNLTTAYNNKFGTTFTTAQLLTTELAKFLPFLVSTIKRVSKMLERNTSLYHLTPVKTDDAGNPLTLLRHTPRDLQRLFLYSPVMLDAETQVLPSLFNDGYLKVENYEGVDFWQNPNDPSAISVTPNQFNPTTGASETGAPVVLKNVIGVLFDRDAIFTTYRMDDVITTPINAVGDYYNTVYHWAKDYNSDYTENCVIFYMEDVPAGRMAAAAKKV